VTGDDLQRTVEGFFADYAEGFNQALGPSPDLDAIAARYTESFIAAGPQGVAVARNDEAFKETLRKGYEFYRSIGTKEMRVRSVDVHPIDDLHALASVHWGSRYIAKDGRAVSIDFDVHYLLQLIGWEPKVFGFISGDEQAVLREHGLV
jgi:hypothetical protein